MDVEGQPEVEQEASGEAEAGESHCRKVFDKWLNQKSPMKVETQSNSDSYNESVSDLAPDSL
jgi:hypothetical protein